MASKRYMYKKELFANVRGCFCDHNTGLAKIAMIVIVKNATVQIKKKVKKNRNQNALKI